MDFKKIKDKLVDFIREFSYNASAKSIIIGLSGGIDSAVTAVLCAEALGAENVFSLYMPYEDTGKSREFSECVAKKYNLNYEIFSIKEIVSEYFNSFNLIDKVRKGNFLARLRMAVLFDYSKLHNGIVAGTSNKSEILLGYFTLFGDSSSSFAALGDLYKTEVIELASVLGLPEDIITQKPSAGLWQGQTDEGEMGFSYKEADEILHYLEDEKMDVIQIADKGIDIKLIEKVKKRVDSNSYKTCLPVIPKLR